MNAISSLLKPVSNRSRIK